MAAIDNNRKNFANAPHLQNDLQQLAKLRDAFLGHYKTSSVFARYFTFGKLKTNVNLWFTWGDSFAKQTKIQTQNVLLDSYSSLYNYGVALARIGILTDLSGDGVKVASASLCKAASVFAYLKTATTNLSPAEVSPDLQSQTLDMNTALCLA